MDFFLFATVTSWIFVMVFFVLFAFNIKAKINLDLDWNLPVITEFVLHVTFNVLLRMRPFGPNERCLDVLGINNFFPCSHFKWCLIRVTDIIETKLFTM